MSWNRLLIIFYRLLSAEQELKLSEIKTVSSNFKASILQQLFLKLNWNTNAEVQTFHALKLSEAEKLNKR